MKLKAKFTLAVSTVVIAILALTAVFVFFHYKQSIRDTIAQQQFRMVSILTDEVDNKLIDSQRQVIALSKITPVDIMRDRAKAQAFLDSKPGEHTIIDNHLFLFTPSGKLFVESPYIPGRRGMDFSSRQYITDTIKYKKPYISDPFKGTQSHHSSMMFTVPLLIVGVK